MNVNALPRTYPDGLPIASFKTCPDDFRVDEILGFELDAEGDHLWVKLQKTDRNTREVVDLLAKQCSLSARDIGYSGLKDKNGITTQWFSLPQVGIVCDLQDTAPEEEAEQISRTIRTALQADSAVELLQFSRNRKKLRTGAHRQNRFKIVLRGVADSQALVDQRLADVKNHGFPNYFGEQRFGHAGGNVEAARAMFQRRRKISRFKRGIYLSAARSYLFNLVLAKRVEDGSWCEVQGGEVCVLDGTNSIFQCDRVDAQLIERHRQFDIHCSGPLYGSGAVLSGGEVAQREANCMQDELDLCAGLEAAGLKNERRALRARAIDLQWHWPAADMLELEFTLQKGVYATALLRELVDVQMGVNGTQHRNLAASSDTTQRVDTQ